MTILRIFECQNKSLDFIMYLINRELNATSERNVLFRINSLATRGTGERHPRDACDFQGGADLAWAVLHGCRRRPAQC